MLFPDLPQLVRALLCFWTVGILLMDSYVFIRYIERDKTGSRFILLCVRMFAAYVLLQMQKSLICGLVDMRYRGALYHIMLNTSAAPVLVLLAVLSGMSFWMRWETEIWEQHHISSMDIKEGTDALPIGLLYFWDDGVIKLCNREMQQISLDMYGQQPQNGLQFWQDLQSGRLPMHIRLVRPGAEPIVAVGAEHICSFRHRGLVMEDQVLHELLATNVTAEYHLSRRLEEQNSRLQEMNERLHRLGDMIAEVTAEKETLEAKIRIHDETGRTMLATRHFLENEDDGGQLHELLKMWESIGMLMHSQAEEEEETEDYLKELRDAAAAIGIRLQINGWVDPSNKELIRILTAGARECLTNAYRHAHAGVLTITVSRDPEHANGWQIEYTNDGLPPSKPVQEGGGLSSLRKTVESAGGSMEIVASPDFVLRIRIDT